MPPDPQVIAALAAAVDADPESCPLRLHLASLMLDVGEAQAALPHLEFVLSREPANVEALLQATRACEALGDPRAAGYRTLATALSTGAATGAPPSPTPEPPPPAPNLLTNPGEPPEKVRRLRVTDSENEEFEEVWEVEKPRVKLADVGGLEHVKKRLNVSFLAPMRNPEIREAFGKSLRGGLLMFGPPGCGKTFIARALAGELDAHFISVGLSEVLDMWLGNSEKNVRAIFELARRQAPTVLFFDEVDAIGRKRVNLTHQAGRNVVNQLLAEMDGADGDNEGVFILGATNHPWDIDSAMMRPGRFDRYTLVLPPDRPARVAILQHHLANRPVDRIDLSAVAEKLEGYSGADIAHLCESAAEMAMEEALEAGVIKPITQAQVLRALKEIQPSTRQWFETARNFAIFANQAGMYDDLVTYMRSRQML
jgi:AAA+ superfamily predicted ATPase